MWYCYLIGVAIILCVTITARCCLCKCFNFNRERIKKILKWFLKIILFIISLDFHLARVCKEKIKTKYAGDENEQIRKDKLKEYIINANSLNLVISFFIGLVVFILKSLTDANCLCIILLVVMSYRFVSRTIEINVSFLLDVFDKNNNSGTNKWQRIQLAFLSLIEEAILFAGIYLFFYDGEICKSILSGLHSFILAPVSDKGCCCQESCGLFSFVTIYQVICSIILITISFATYISGDKESDKK